MDIDFYWPKPSKPDFELEDKISATYVRMVCARVLPFGATIKRPAWHSFVYGGGRNPNT